MFGCPITVRLPGKRPAKLDTHATKGIFLGFTATENNVYYLDSRSKKIKIATHVTFDEAGFTLPDVSQTILQKRLQEDIKQLANATPLTPMEAAVNTTAYPSNAYPPMLSYPHGRRIRLLGTTCSVPAQ